MRFLTALSTCLLLIFSLHGQNLNIQFIHNSTLEGSQTGPALDIYLDEEKVADSLTFREATRFLEADTAGLVQLGFALAPSDSAGQSFAVFNSTAFSESSRYRVFIYGEFANPANPFGIQISPDIPVSAAGAGQVDFQWINGSADQPNAAFGVQRQTIRSEDLDRGQNGNRQSLPAGNYTMTFGFGDGPATQYLFTADLSLFTGSFVSIFSSGYFAGGSPAGRFYAVSDDGTVTPLPRVVFPRVVINEVDYDQPGADNAEFIELKNVSEEIVDLNAWSIELWNGALNEPYNIISLPALTIAPGDLFLVCFGSEVVGSCDIEVSGSIQNGGSDPDGIALLYRNAIADALSYEGTLPGYSEGSGTSLEDGDQPELGLSRVPDGRDTDQNGQDFKLVCATPGRTNVDTTDCTTLTGPDSTLVQIFHNATAPDVDLYLNGKILLSGLAPLGASPFVKIPAGQPVDLSIVPAGADPASAVLETTGSTFSVEKNYFVVVEGAAQDTARPLELIISDAARVEAALPFAVDFRIYHGAFDAPPVDVNLRQVGAVADTLAYQSFTTYNAAIPGLYILDILESSNAQALASFELDLSALSGAAMHIVATGSIAEGTFQLLGVLEDGTVQVLPPVVFAELQLIHNVPNIRVDIYLNDDLVVDDFDYRNATAFLPVRANYDIRLDIKAEDSNPASPSILSFSDLNFAALSRNTLFIGGDGTPERPVDLFINSNARAAAADSSVVALAFHHGATDLQQIGIQLEDNTSLFQDLGYGEYQDYYNFPPESSRILLRESEENTLGIFRLDLDGLEGSAGVIFSSGVATGSGTLGLFLALADGTVVELPRLAFARAQFLHNALPAKAVDVYVNDRKIRDNLDYRQATAFMDILAEEPLHIALVPADRESLDSALVVFENIQLAENESYLLVANGNLDNDQFPLELQVVPGARENLVAGFSIPTAALHGIPGLPPVDLLITDLDTLFEDLGYGEFQDYRTLVPQDYILSVYETISGVLVGNFDLDMTRVLPGEPMVLVASGQVEGMPGPVMLGVQASGAVYEFPAVGFGQFQLINALTDQAIDLYLDGELLAAGLEFREAIPYTNLRVGMAHELRIVEAGGAFDAPLLVRSDLEIGLDDFWMMVAAGQVGDAQRPPALYLNPDSRLDAGGPNKLAFNFFHGGQDAPAIDIVLQNITTLHRNVAFGSYTEYTVLEPLSSDPVATFDIKQAGTESINPPHTARGDFRDYDNLAITIFGSGFLINRVLPGFELWAALPDGQTVPLEVITGVFSLDPDLSGLRVFPNPVSGQLQVQYSLAQAKSLHSELYTAQGKLLQKDLSVTWPAGKHQFALPTENLPNGLYILRLVSGEGQRSIRFQVQR